MKNVLFITVDSLRADYVFGEHAPETLETLPKMAENGLSFTNAFSAAPFTKQSFLSIMSGTYPWHFDSETDGYEPARPHVAELLTREGYETGGFHTNTYLSPAYNYDRGFNQYMGRDSTDEDGDSASKRAYNRFVQKAVTVGGVSDIVHRLYKTAGERFGIQLGSSLYKPAAEINDAVVSWTEGRSEPVFIWAHYMDVHNPYYPHEGTVSEGIDRRKAIQLFHRVNELRADARDEELELLERLYRGEIQYFDRQLGDLLSRIDETIGLSDTVVVFTSDHGEAFGENGRVFHPGNALYDENIHIPIIIQGPNIERGAVETPVTNVDLVPTILSQLGIEQPPAMDGVDVTSFSSDPPEERLVFTESFTKTDGNAMVTDGSYKLIRNMETGSESLYDRTTSDGETRDLRDDAPDVRMKLETALDDHVRAVETKTTNTAQADVTEDVKLQLRKLGYDE